MWLPRFFFRRLRGRFRTAMVVGLGLVSVNAWAGANDLSLLNLCGAGVPRALSGGNFSECGWVSRDPSGRVTGVQLNADAETRFRSLMSELGMVLSPAIVTPADTLGFAGFQISVELGLTRINNDKVYWDGVDAVSPQNRLASRPDPWLTTVGMFVRKGIWLPVPSMEVGAGFIHLLQSQMIAYQAYAKLALLEGFQHWPLPSVALRAGLSHVTGSAEARLDVANFDVLASKAVGIAGTFRLEPFGGWSYVMIRAKSGFIDATPGCDGHLTNSGLAGGAYCGPTLPDNDLAANFQFRNQSAILRQRYFGGMKLKFAAVFLAAQYEFIPAGRSRDTRTGDGMPLSGAKDSSGRQTRVSISGGLDF